MPMNHTLGLVYNIASKCSITVYQ